MGLGMPEVILILVVALIIFGPRKLPELGKTLGQAMSQFRRASDDFKRTWEQEVEMEKYRTDSTPHSVESSSSSSEYNSSNETYNPYSGEYESTDHSTAQLNEAPHTNAVEQEPAKAEAATVGVTATPEPKQQHWI